MEGRLKPGTTICSERGNTYTINKILGSGGQGEVYDISDKSGHYALKWYFKHTATLGQEKILKNLMEKGSPAPCFLWPQDMVYDRKKGIFGYIMPLRPEEYKSIVDLMKRKAEPSFFHLCKAAYNLTRGYQMLHAMGYSYRDISFVNVFFNPENGSVLICDNDNVSVNGTEDSYVYGTPRFMAPEIVLGKEKPSRNTDLFSLAVLLFYMFMLNHPLEGKQEAMIKCMDVHGMRKLYGTNPVFIFDPKNRSNRPMPGYQDNALIYWDLYPKYLKDLFEKSFTVGLTEPAKRVTENKWLEVIANLMTNIMICPDCGAEIFYDPYKEENHIAHTCWNCGKKADLPAKMVIDKYKILLTSGAKVFSHHLYDDHDMKTIVAKVVQNPKNPSLWGLRNETKQEWIYKKNDGSSVPVPPGKAATIARDTEIDFATPTGATAIIEM